MGGIASLIPNPLPIEGTFSAEPPVGGATEAKQDTGNASLATIAGKDFATQTTLAALLAKVIAAPATEAKQDTANNHLNTIAGWGTGRANVNLILDQQGITANAGPAGDSTPRVILAGDDPAVVSLGVMDDWDESDRAKVNIIAGQAGVTAGAGSVAANTPRMTHASDDPAVTSLQLIDDVVGATGAAVPAKAVLMGGVVGGNIVALNVTAGGGMVVGTMTPGGAANNLGKVVDAAVGASDTGVASLAKRVDSLAAITPAAGDYAHLQVDNQGSLWVRNSTVQTTSYQKANITTATTSTPKSGGGLFHSLVINKAVAAGTIDIYDNTAASGTKIGTITFGATVSGDPVTLLFDCFLTTGLTLVTSTTFDLTVMYN